jgi:hypothetical protein
MPLRLVPKMASRRFIATAGALLVLGIAGVLGATQAFAANCGNGQGQAVLLGCANNASIDTTVITVPSNGFSGLWVSETGTGSWGIRADGTDRGVSATGGDTGVYGAGVTYGVAGSSPNTGVYGAGTYAVWGAGTGTFSQGVHGDGTYGVAGFGTGASGNNYGVYGSGGYGVVGVGTYGVEGAGDTAGLYGLSTATDNTGVGLQVIGRSVFRTAGTAVIASGKKSVTVTLAGVTTSDFVLATVQGSGAFYVKNASTASGQFTIFINKAPTSPATVTVAYFVISAS